MKRNELTGLNPEQVADLVSQLSNTGCPLPVGVHTVTTKSEAKFYEVIPEKEDKFETYKECRREFVLPNGSTLVLKCKGGAITAPANTTFKVTVKDYVFSGRNVRGIEGFAAPENVA